MEEERCDARHTEFTNEVGDEDMESVSVGSADALPRGFDEDVPITVVHDSGTRANRTKIVLATCAVFTVVALIDVLSLGLNVTQSEPIYAETALGLTQKILSFGPRLVGDTKGHARTRSFLTEKVSHLHSFEPLKEHTFVADTAVGSKTFVNLYTRAVTVHTTLPACHLVLSAHYDSMDVSGKKGFMGASDSVTSLALIIRAMQQLEYKLIQPSTMACNVTVVFFDGEEAFKRWQGKDNTYGSRQFAEDWAEDPTRLGWGADYSLASVTTFALLDLLGTDDCGIPVFYDTTLEDYKELVRAEVGYLSDVGETDLSKRVFTQQTQHHLSDDHLPFLAATCGVESSCVPVLHLISYRGGKFPKVWHTMDDNEEAIDGRVMAQLEAVLVRWVVDKATIIRRIETDVPTEVPPTSQPTLQPTAVPDTPRTLPPDTAVPDTQIPETYAPNANRTAADFCREILGFGPRPVPPTEEDVGGHKAAKEYLLAAMREEGTAFEEPRVQMFDADTLLGRRRFWNLYSRIVAPYNSSTPPCHTVLSAHYDTYTRTDCPDFTGAVDSASGLALILRMMRTISDMPTPPRCNVSILLLDGEESFIAWNKDTDAIFGAKEFSTKWADGDISGWEEEYSLASVTSFALLDLLGATGTTVPMFFEDTRSDYAKLVEIEDEVVAQQTTRSGDTLQVAVPYRVFSFSHKVYGAIEDDHIAFLKTTCPTGRCTPILHLICSPFPRVWHTNFDTIDALDWNVISRLESVFNLWIQWKVT